MNARATMFPTAGADARRAYAALRWFLVLEAALLGAALLATAARPARASDDDAIRRWDGGYGSTGTWAEGRLVDVQLRVDGEAAPLYFTPDHGDRHYFQAFAGRNYSIVLRNTTGRRIAVLLAVDGLNAVNGEISRLRPDEDMYVLGPYDQATIRGWRTSLDEVRRFVFVDERRSYAERTGQANSDMGWIRVLGFREQLPWWQRQPQPEWGKLRSNYRDGAPGAPVPFESAPRAQSDESKDGPPAPERSLAPKAQDNLAKGESDDGGSFPGTGWGRRQQDRVTRVQFTPDPVAVDHLIFRYEYASGLQALGIVPVRRFRDRLGERDGEIGFARPPRW